MEEKRGLGWKEGVGSGGQVGVRGNSWIDYVDLSIEGRYCKY